MSEFKLACPVCGQHITSDSSASGSQLECPTCFQKIVVPQAPTSPDAKFILSASQVGKPRPTSANGGDPSATAAASPGKKSLIAAIAFFVVLCAAGGLAFAFRGKLFKNGAEETAQAKGGSNGTGKKTPGIPPKIYPIPTNIVWTLELANAAIPETPAAGSIHGS